MLTPSNKTISHALYKRACEQLSKLADGRGVVLIVACSGGADSMALLHIANLYCQRNNLSVKCVHINHQLRAEASDGDASYVERMCCNWDIECRIIRVDTPAMARENKKGIEANARDLRYAALAHECARYSNAYLLVAHTANDQAETVLLQLMRGAGTRGLAAMQPLNGIICRPLLDCTRVEIEDYCREHGIAYCYDDSNDDDRYLRNFVRHDVLTLIERRKPAITQVLCRTAQIMRAEDDYLEAAVDAIYPTAVLSAQHGLVLDKHVCAAQAIAIQWRLIKRIFKTAFTGTDVEFAKIQLLQAELVREHGNKVLTLGKHAFAYCSSTDILLSSLKVEREAIPVLDDIMVNGAGEYALPDGRNVRVTIGKYDAQPCCSSEQCLIVPFNKVLWPLTLRSRRSGDVITMKYGSKSLKKLFIDNKIPAAMRNGMVVVADLQKIIGVLGLVTSVHCSSDFSVARAVIINISK